MLSENSLLVYIARLVRATSGIRAPDVLTPIPTQDHPFDVEFIACIYMNPTRCYESLCVPKVRAVEWTPDPKLVRTWHILSF